VRKKLRKLLKLQDGTVAIEFSLVAAVLVTLILSTIELGVMSFSQVAVEGAASSAARYAKIHRNQDSNQMATYIETEVSNKTAGLLSGKNLEVTPKVLEVTAGKDAVVEINIVYDWQPLSPLMSVYMNNQPFQIRSTAIIRSE
jgi:Flp pilus assembly protein TadG